MPYQSITYNNYIKELDEIGEEQSLDRMLIKIYIY